MLTKTIPTDWIAPAQGALAKLNRKAAKLNVPQATMTVANTHLRRGFDQFNRRITYEVADVTINLSEPIKFAGYTFVARLDYEGSAVLGMRDPWAGSSRALSPADQRLRPLPEDPQPEDLLPRSRCVGYLPLRRFFLPSRLPGP